MDPWDEQEWEDWAHYEELRDAAEAVARSLDEWLAFEEELCSAAPLLCRSAAVPALAVDG